MTDAAATARIRFPGIHPNAFEHPMDRAALDTLRRTPGLDLLLKKLSALSVERAVRLYFTVDSLRLSPRQCPRVYRLLHEAASVLDMPEPELYLAQYPLPNAAAIGMERFTITLTSGLLELMEDDELRTVLAHELGHIKSGHMLYRTMAIFLGVLGGVALRNMPFFDLLTKALEYALYDWMRKSELTADRAGLLVAQDDDVVVRTLLKLASGGRKVAAELSVEEFLKQADEYEDMQANILDALYSFEMTRYMTHPFPALRAKEIARWSRSEEYRRILRGEYAQATPAEERRCPACGATMTNPLFRFCPECGGEL